MIRNIITEIQSLGIHVNKNITGRNGGAGPAEGRAFLINGVPVNAPIAAAYVSKSPFTLQKRDSGYSLLKNDLEVTNVNVVKEPEFYSRSTSEGIPYKKIALLHGKDCLATTVLQRCVHWKHSRKCSFCATEFSLANKGTIAEKTPAQLAEVAKVARDLDGITHMVLTSGTGDPPGSEIPYLAECARAVKALSPDLPVQVQIAPPKDLELIDELRDAGIESIGIHIESFDTDILSKVAPAKAAIGLAHYEKTWKRAVELFGTSQVSSFIIAGLGEDPASIAWGSELLADLGVFPFVVPLRPIPGSKLENATPPGPYTMKHIYDAVARILQTKGISSHETLAGCVRCGACSSLSLYEKKKNGLICHSARNRFEKSEAFRIRREVFVDEQGLFNGSDMDENDSCSIHLIAKQKEKVIGTVRIYKEKKEGDHWVGGRLAVEKNFRATNAGSALVKEAMKRVKKKGCRVFTAHIQEKNIPFFLKLGWEPMEPVKSHFGRPHQKMQVNLDIVPEDIQI